MNLRKIENDFSRLQLIFVQNALSTLSKQQWSDEHSVHAHSFQFMQAINLSMLSSRLEQLSRYAKQLQPTQDVFFETSRKDFVSLQINKNYLNKFLMRSSEKVSLTALSVLNVYEFCFVWILNISESVCTFMCS